MLDADKTQDLATRSFILGLLKEVCDEEDVVEFLDRVAYDPSEWGESDFNAIAKDLFPLWIPKKASIEERDRLKKAIISDRKRLIAALSLYRKESMHAMKKEFLRA